MADVLLGCLQPCLGSLQGKGHATWVKQKDWDGTAMFSIIMNHLGYY